MFFEMNEQEYLSGIRVDLLDPHYSRSIQLKDR
jgi:hypothetical protein